METAKKTPQGLIMEYNWAQKLYDETLDLKDTTELRTHEQMLKKE